MLLFKSPKKKGIEAFPFEKAAGNLQQQQQQQKTWEVLTTIHQPTKVSSKFHFHARKH